MSLAFSGKANKHPRCTRTVDQIRDGLITINILQCGTEWPCTTCKVHHEETWYASYWVRCTVLPRDPAARYSAQSDYSVKAVEASVDVSAIPMRFGIALVESIGPFVMADEPNARRSARSVAVEMYRRVCAHLIALNAVERAAGREPAFEDPSKDTCNDDAGFAKWINEV